ncbi:MAG: hypothetical protein J0665_20200 [Deltaproteobacteria bacterium]|jgi:hypothetical protein|nr:hypothetical protein [Deltaproteobacteria bacterium]
MRNFATTAMTVMTMALLLSMGTVPVLAASGPGSNKTALQERKSQHTVAKRNAAAKALKAKLNKDKQVKNAPQATPSGK